MSTTTRILLIDDDEDDILLLIMALREHFSNAEILVEHDSEKAIQKITGGTLPVPDFIFLDLNMPKINGKEFLAYIKTLPAFQRVPVIIYTTSPLAKDRNDVKLLGASYFLTKPNSMNELRIQVTCALHEVSVM